MVFPDANLLLYAVNTDSMDHAQAHGWWRDLLSSDAPVGLYTGVVFAFARLSTNRRVFTSPLSVEESFSYLNNWLSFPTVQWVDAELEDIPVVESLLMRAGTGSNLVSDAQIAAASIRLKGTVHSADADFGRFKGVKWVNPLKQ